MGTKSRITKLLGSTVALIAALVLVAGCAVDTSDEGGAAEPSPTVSATNATPSGGAPGPQTFNTVVEFKDAMVAAGYSCDPWEPDSEQEKGRCNDNDELLAVLDDTSALDAWVADYKTDPDGTYPVIYGGNWFAVVDSAAELASVTAKMYGTSYTPPPPPEPVVSIECGDDTYQVTDLSKPEAVLQKAWAGKHDECDGTRDDADLTGLEKKALKTAGYSKSTEDAGYLWAFCAENEKGDYGQEKEMKGWLVLCPHHPQAKAWKARIKKLEMEERLKKDGRSFYSGTYRVGKEIKPGTYFVKGDIENCYWERQDRNGNIIDNYVTLRARRVQVTIRSSDYAFSSEGCGNWRPVK